MNNKCTTIEFVTRCGSSSTVTIKRFIDKPDAAIKYVAKEVFMNHCQVCIDAGNKVKIFISNPTLNEIEKVLL